MIPYDAMVLRQILIAALGLAIGFVFGSSWQHEVGPRAQKAPRYEPRAKVGDWLGIPPRHAQDDSLEQLSALGYVQGLEDAAEETGVLVHQQDRSQPGLTLLVSSHRPYAALMDLQGEVQHQWGFAYDKACPQVTPDPKKLGRNYWRRVALLPDGGIIAVYDYNGIVRIGRDGILQWAKCEPYHHDVSLPSGELLTLFRKPRLVDGIVVGQEVFDDEIHVIDPENGRVKQRVSILDAFAGSNHFGQLATISSSVAVRQGDVLHTNAVRQLTQSVGPFQQGHWLISMRHLHVVATIDPQTGLVSWALGGLWRGQHDPSITDDGSLLVFDNFGAQGASRVIEVDPTTQDKRWAFDGFHSRVSGSAQRLANGNTLVVDSANGRVLEVSPSKEVVWLYVNPHRVHQQGQESIAMIHAAERVRAPGWLHR